MSRPYARTERVQTTLRPDEEKRVDDYAASILMSQSGAIRELILVGLEVEEHNKRGRRLGN